MPEDGSNLLAVTKRKGAAFKGLEPTACAHNAPLSTAIEDCFNWTPAIKSLQLSESASFYLVLFRSIRKPCADTGLLYAADLAAQVEAKHSGGLLRYWYGTLNTRRECLAMCIWESREAAVKALHKPAHKVAMELASQMYDTYTLEKYWLRIDPHDTTQFNLIFPPGV